MLEGSELSGGFGSVVYDTYRVSMLYDFDLKNKGNVAVVRMIYLLWLPHHRIVIIIIRAVSVYVCENGFDG